MVHDSEQKPLVSIDCLTYNHGPYVRKALESFINQKTKFNYEVLVHDDASTDNTAKIIKEFEQKYPKIIKPIYQQENQYSKNVNISKTIQCPRAKGKYIAMCEGDDYWTDQYKLQKQVDFLESNPDYGFVHCNFDKLYNKTGNIRKNTNKIDINNFNSQDEVFQGMLLNTYRVGTLTVLARKELLCESFGSIDLSGHLMGDLPTWLELSQKTKFHFIHESVGVYRKISGSASNTENRYNEFIDSGLRIRMEFANKYRTTNNVKGILENYYIKNLLKLAFRTKNQEYTDRYLKEIEIKKYSLNIIEKIVHCSLFNNLLYNIIYPFYKITDSIIFLIKYLLKRNIH